MRCRFGIDVDSRVQTRIDEVASTLFRKVFRGKKNQVLREAYEQQLSHAPDETKKTSKLSIAN